MYSIKPTLLYKVGKSNVRSSLIADVQLCAKSGPWYQLTSLLFWNQTALFNAMTDALSRKTSSRTVKLGILEHYVR